MKKKTRVSVLLSSLVVCCVGAGCGSSSDAGNLSVVSAQTAVLPMQSGESSDAVPVDKQDDMDMGTMADKRMKRELTRDGSMYVRSETVNRPLVRFPDGQLSNSDSCAVRMENKLNRRIPPAYVNGQPIGFC